MAEKKANEKGLTVEWGKNGYMKTKCTISGFEYFPKWDQNVLYSAIADHSVWFDNWPTVMEKPYIKTFEGADETERPLAITFGDGEEFTREGNIYNSRQNMYFKISFKNFVILAKFSSHGDHRIQFIIYFP